MRIHSCIKQQIKTFDPDSVRGKDVAEHGYSTKFVYHVVRLLDEAEQALTTGTIDLTNDKERLKAIRNGEWTFEQVQDFFTEKERVLESAYASSTLPRKPPVDKLKQLMLDCLEHHYGTVADAVTSVSDERRILQEIKLLIEKV